MEVAERLEAIAKELGAGKPVEPITVRDFLAWFNTQRRGSFIVWLIREKLAEAGLSTEPNFESAYIDSQLAFRLMSTSPGGDLESVGKIEIEADQHGAQEVDPTYRLSRLEAANRVPVSVCPTATITAAVTIMATNDFSQLPVMTSPRDVKGVVSWSSVGVRFGMGQSPSEVRQAMDEPQEISADASLFQAIPVIVKHQYVLVRGKDQRIVGIVTASDLSLQFQQLSEPFLLIGEIENYVRSFIARAFTREELLAVKDESDAARSVNGVNDLTFGEYLRLIDEPSRWKRLALSVDRRVVCDELDRVRVIRNDVMHFDPDGILSNDLDHLRRVANFLRRLVQVAS